MRRGRELFRGVDSGPRRVSLVAPNRTAGLRRAYVRDLMGEHEVGRALVRG
jgi:hypothetical protein